jgi:hypothetical protein
MSLRHNVVNWLRAALTRSSIIHARQQPAQNAEELVELIDRFLDDKLRYDMEWDDFISWKSDSHQVESLRNEIGNFEGLLFSNAPEDRLAYCERLIEIRNRTASFFSKPPR